MTSNKDKALAILRAKLDEAEIKLGTYKAALELKSETGVSGARVVAINEFFRRFIDNECS